VIAITQLTWGTLPPQSRDEIWASNAQASWVRGTAEEYTRGSASAEEAASLRDVGDKPLCVLTAGQHPASEMAAQERMLRLSTNSVQQTVHRATHTDLLIKGKNAAVTAQAILAAVDSARNNRRSLAQMS
jgi:hypothetical protein